MAIVFDENKVKGIAKREAIIIVVRIVIRLLEDIFRIWEISAVVPVLVF